MRLKVKKDRFPLLQGRCYDAFRIRRIICCAVSSSGKGDDVLRSGGLVPHLRVYVVIALRVQALAVQVTNLVGNHSAANSCHLRIFRLTISAQQNNGHGVPIPRSRTNGQRVGHYQDASNGLDRINRAVSDLLDLGDVLAPGGSPLLGRLLGLDRGRVLGGLLGRDGLGRNDDLLAVGQVGGGDGVHAAFVGGELRAGVGDGGNQLTVVRRNRKREVEGVGNVNGLGIRLGRDALLGAVLRAVLQRRGGDLNVEGDGGVGLLCGRLLGLGLVGLTVRSRRLGVLGRGLDGVLLRLGRRLLGIVLRGRLIVGGVGLLRGRHLPLGARVLGGRIHDDLVATLGPAGGQDVGERLDVGRLHHEDDAEEDRQYGLPPLLRLLTPEVLALMPLVHTNHSLNVLGTT